MKKVAIFMSDFHLGRKDRMEEFYADEEFAELIGRLSMKYAEDEVDLVLLGDVMDLWTTITDPKEVNAKTANDVKIYFPVPDGNQQAMKEAVQSELERAQAVMDAHSLFFETLGRFLARDPKKRKIIYVPGNHDHSMVERNYLQPEVRKKILEGAKQVLSKASSDATLAEVAERIQFPYFYKDTTLKVYAEHGNQLTFAGAFRYESFPVFGKECPGYYELKLVWNRLERGAPELDNVFMGAFRPALWPGIFWWLMRKPLVWRKLRRYQIQYEDDKRAVPFRKRMPKPRAALWHVLKTQWSATKDEFGDQLLRLFDKESKDVRPVSAQPDNPSTWWLDPQEVKTIILGHSHQTRDVDLPGLKGVKYYNTGSWIFHYENGRRLVEQTWVTISTELDGGRLGGPPRRIDREMVRRRVELSRKNEAPVTADGYPLNAVMREMPDLRVGDVVLFRWNFGATLKRMLWTAPLGELLHTIQHMGMSWFNRYGTFSYWSHVAMVFGSPTERAESDEYNDPLFLETVPDTGVAIHGPQEYLTHWRDWNIAILRLKEPWMDDWGNRRLLRRRALSTLQVNYDTASVLQITRLYSGEAMESRGRPVVGGLVRGAVAGGIVVFAWPLLIGAFYVLEYARANGWHGLASAAVEWVQGTWKALLTSVDQWHISPVRLGPISELLFSGDRSFQLLGWCLTGVVGLFLAMVALGLLWVVGYRLLLAGAAFGAICGALIVPVMAELAGGWRSLSSATRWLITGIWLLIPTVAIFSGVVLVEVVEMQKDLTGQAVNSPHVVAKFVEITGVTFLLVATVGVGCLLPFAKAGGAVLTAVGSFFSKLCGGFWKRSANREQRLFAKSALREKQFICSTFVYEALDNVGEAAAVRAAAGGVDTDPAKKLVLPRHFAESNKFKWVYLLLDGVVIPQPDEVQQAQVGAESLDEKAENLIPAAKWAFLLALTGLVFVACSDLLRLLKHPEQVLMGLDGRRWFWILQTIGWLCGLGALRCAFQTRRTLALEPARRGEVLLAWGVFLAAMGLVGSILILSAMSFGPNVLLINFWWVVLLVALIAAVLF